MIVEAWDEPTSENPGGRHGNDSVFYEGRAARFTLTRPIHNISLPTNTYLETDITVLDRLSELAVCSNFQRVTGDEIDNNSISGCVSKQSITHVKKRSLLSRNKRSGEVHHPSVKSLLQNVGKYLNTNDDSLSNSADKSTILFFSLSFSLSLSLSLCGRGFEQL